MPVPALTEHSTGCPLAGAQHQGRAEPSQLRLQQGCARLPTYRQSSVLVRAKKADQQEQQPAGAGVKEDSKQEAFDLDSVNPWLAGRRTRRAFDDVWQRFTKLGSPISTAESNLLTNIPDDGQPPQAAYTRVLVIGATGRVGRTLVRKLQLRGYTVVAMVRSLEETGLPQSVQLVQGDVTDYTSCRQALQDIDKVVYAAAPRSDSLEDHTAVHQQGIATVAKAFQDLKNYKRQTLRAHSNGVVSPSDGAAAEGAPADGSAASNGSGPDEVPGNLDTGKLVLCKRGHFAAWELEQAGPEPLAQQAEQGPMASQSVDDPQASGEDWASSLGAQALSRFARSQRTSARKRAPVQEDTAKASLNSRKSLLFKGSLHSRGAKAIIAMPLQADQDGNLPLAGCEGITMRIGSDGSPFQLQLRTEAGTYSHRFQGNAKGNFTNVQLPFNEFRPEGRDMPPLDPGTVYQLAICRDLRQADAARASAAFSLELLRMKALPGGSEPDFILVSCASTLPLPGLDAFENDRFSRVKRGGEQVLRQSGLGYVIVRPAQLLEEPGGYKALIFDQASRITAGISAVDVADVCLRALHEPNARNKAFEVCNEAPVSRAYELVAHLPDRTSNYLQRALQPLEKNI